MSMADARAVDGGEECFSQPCRVAVLRAGEIAGAGEIDQVVKFFWSGRRKDNGRHSGRRSRET
jgi:hypothetical protein